MGGRGPGGGVGGGGGPGGCGGEGGGGVTPPHLRLQLVALPVQLTAGYLLFSLAHQLAGKQLPPPCRPTFSLV
eukprot:COSAG05_NODE_1971_length_3766_cov_556.224434_3_plen_73_part_00